MNKWATSKHHLKLWGSTGNRFRFNTKMLWFPAFFLLPLGCTSLNQNRISKMETTVSISSRECLTQGAGGTVSARGEKPTEVVRRPELSKVGKPVQVRSWRDTGGRHCCGAQGPGSHGGPSPGSGSHWNWPRCNRDRKRRGGIPCLISVSTLVILPGSATKSTRRPADAGAW